MFGELPQDPTSKPIRLAVPTRAANPIEQELRAMMYEATITHADVPLVFVEDGEHNADDFIPIFGRPFNLDEALAIGGIMAEPVVERFRRQIAIASELGAKATLPEFIAACIIEGVDPLLQEK
jgi:hypothetical protein